MRVLVISDIHANFTALETVLADAGAVDETWCLGDLVGYGPDPNEVVERVRGLPNLTCLLGNHDVAAIGKIPFESFNVDFLLSLPSSLTVKGDASLVHGSPRDSIWEYILNALSARLNFAHFTTPWCMVGHSHLQCMFRLHPENERVTLESLKVNEAMILKPRLIMNPGSVGQPRDRDPRAAYAIYDTEEKKWEPRRVTYDIRAVQKRIREAKLPEKHAMRLMEGW